jgi:hypothetical protein
MIFGTTTGWKALGIDFVILLAFIEMIVGPNRR